MQHAAPRLPDSQILSGFANLKHIYLSLAARQPEATAPATGCRSWLKRTNYLSINRKGYLYRLQPYHPPCHAMSLSLFGQRLSFLLRRRLPWTHRTWHCRDTPGFRSGPLMWTTLTEEKRASPACKVICDMTCSDVVPTFSYELYEIGLVLSLRDLHSRTSYRPKLANGPGP
jgi:hypothetical protein